MITVAETGEFSRHCKRILNEIEREALIDYLAAHPEAGDVIEGTGGIRKIRWAREGRGKSGGVRIIYYFHSPRMPLYLLTLYGKNDKANLAAGEKTALRGLVDLLKKANGL